MAATRITQPNEAPFGVNLGAAGGAVVSGSSAVSTQALPPSAAYAHEEEGRADDAADVEAVHSREFGVAIDEASRGGHGPAFQPGQSSKRLQKGESKSPEARTPSGNTTS